MEQLRELSRVEIILAFASSCVESVARTLALPYHEAYRKMSDAGLFDRMIFPHYEVLHMESRETLIQRLIEQINNH